MFGEQTFAQLRTGLSHIRLFKKPSLRPYFTLDRQNGKVTETELFLLAAVAERTEDCLFESKSAPFCLTFSHLKIINLCAEWSAVCAACF